MASKKNPSSSSQVDLFSFLDGSLQARAAKKPVPKAPRSKPQTKKTPEPEPAPAVEEESQEQILSVSDLAKSLRDHLKQNFSNIVVQGEIADFKGIHRSGHLYFGLKDESAQVRAVMWKGAVNKVPFKIEGGLEVIIRGKVDFYAGGGSMQIVVEHMEPVGIGALQLKFEQLKKQLRDEGLFELERKRPIPKLAWRIGVVTGKSTAAFQDMQKVLRHRFPLAEIYLFHAAVQGARAAGEIVHSLEAANKYSALRVERGHKPLDVIVLGRGGGSYEDLFCFNDESVARAIVASDLPVVTGIGHEIDTTIADFVSDHRAATPSHAVAAVVPEISDWLNRLDQIQDQMSYRLEAFIGDLAQKIDHMNTRLVNAAPHKQLAQSKETLMRIRDRMLIASKSQIEMRKSEVKSLAQVLDALSPLKVLDRGYSIVRDSEDKVVRSADNLKTGDKILVEWSKTKTSATVI